MITERPSELATCNLEAALVPLVSNFELRPLENGRKMRELLEQNRAEFPIAAARIFGHAASRRGCRYLVTILWIQDLLTPLFANLAIPQELCSLMASTAAQVDPKFQVRLSAFFERVVLDADDPPPEVATRILEILNAAMDPASIAPLLRRILLHPNARVRSKATLLIGRGHTGIGALEKLVLDEDPRVRANAVEALWSNPDPRAHSVFLEALKDTNNRVIGNAILGLYLSGSTTAIAATVELASRQSALFRGTAAWIMGRTADPRFLGVLGRLLGESTGQLRKIVFHSLQSSRAAALARTQGKLVPTVLGSFEDSALFHLQLAVTEESRGENQSLPATAFILSVGSEPINEFSCKVEKSQRSFVAFVLPGFGEGSLSEEEARSIIASLLDSKAEDESWSILLYSSQRSSPPSRGPADAGKAKRSPPQKYYPAMTCLPRIVAFYSLD